MIASNSSSLSRAECASPRASISVSKFICQSAMKMNFCAPRMASAIAFMAERPSVNASTRFPCRTGAN
ncbi:hypothetical protein [Stenotrophomonas maltophilia]|uniref:hypothetical protein n=1 Tax=Stenotrophomonas maltophilia TaxID=40324 RepID=UPI0021C9B059|nr:hypothetical protein [Stenotrophomonas maltophilia]